MSARIIASKASLSNIWLRSTLARNASKAVFTSKLCSPIVKQSCRVPIQSRSFSVCVPQFNHTSAKVADILKSELKIETDVIDQPTEENSYDEFLQKFDYSIIETPGKNLAQIEKKVGNEEVVKVFFDVAQVANLPYDAQMLESTTDNTDLAENNSESLNDEFDSMADKFANVKVVVVKNATQSAVSFELLMNLDEGSFYIDSVTPFKSAEAALDESANAEVGRELIYQGPPFSNLDTELQESLEIYLESRGVNSELSSFIAAYSEAKENKEYVEWLKEMKNYFE